MNDHHRRGRLRTLACGAAVSAIALTAGLSVPAAANDFYAGKQIVFLIGGDAGGGYDLYARALSRHMGRFIPGAPIFVPRNQPGAGSGTAAAYLASVAPKDGTYIGAVFPGVIIGPLLEEKQQGLFDPTKFVYLGSADSGTRVCVTYQNSKIKTFEDAQKNKVIIGASAAGGSTRDYAYLHVNAAGAQFNVVSGYKGTVDIFLAMERGEVDGMCGLDWSSLKSQRPTWVSEKKINILVQNSIDPEPELERMGVPPIWKFVKSEQDRQAVEMVFSQQIFGRPYLAPPGANPAQVKVLRDAFMTTVKDPEFLADAEKSRLDVTASSGERVQGVVEKLYSSSKETVKRAKEIISPPS
ncbi:MAG: Tripartite-type tricarboxylate transporter, receptor component TctC [Hyphomicrobiales bacterium]|nr:Tripartite-type tricarboxylate transporter, receptor component TctC [Hyphomicrobiales bacterium]